MKGWKIKIMGIIQSVGFRSFIYRLAKKTNFNGYVRNRGFDVEIYIEGNGNLDEFKKRLLKEKPIFSRITKIEAKEEETQDYKDFKILETKKEVSYVFTPFIGITIGDPAGIGPEVVVKALSSQDITKNANFIVIGDKRVISRYGNLDTDILDLKNINIKSLVMGEPTADTGRASLEYIMEAFRLIKEKRIDAMVTAPICKSAIQKASFKTPHSSLLTPHSKFIGHTELLAYLSKKKAGMMFVAGNLKVVLATIHIPLLKACKMITTKRIYEIIRLTNHSLIDYFRIEKPNICVLGLNPHSGEDGIMGKEEERIKEAINEANNYGINVSGPEPPDTAFLKKGFDCFIAMYHDQGLIPLKLLAFDKAVNLTIGLPFIRTSPDHGCAFDIAGCNKANPESMIEAIKLAIKLRI